MFKKFLLYFALISAALLYTLNIHSQENIQNDRFDFENYYAYNPINIQAKVPSYKLPLDIKSITNFNDFIRKIPLKEDAVKLIAKNGFVVIENPFFKNEEDITAPYEAIKNNNIPVFITTDSLLHLYHIQFDETLRQVEEKEFYDYIWELSSTLFNKSMDAFNSANGDLKEALKRNVAYFSTALMLLKPKNDQLCKDEKECNDPGLKSAYFSQEDLEKYTFDTPEFVKDNVGAELKLIKAHKGFDNSPIFIYKEDYSQYVPRGHYTRSEKLKNYFKAFTWFGRMSMLLKGTDQVEKGKACNEVPPCKALISLYDAKIQTMQASLIASIFNEEKQLFSKWERIYNVTAFYVGFSDDLGPYEYIEALDYVFNDGFTPDKLTDENIEKIKIKLAEYSSPKIYGGTGELALYPPYSPEQIDELLTITKGFRLMGQRFVPDSYMFTELVSPSVGMYIGNKCSQTFTCKFTGGGPARVFPRGLDVMALLGSKKALELLRAYGDTEYRGYDSEGNIIGYDTQFNKLREEFNSFTILQWQKNLYWSWLYSLKTLLEEFENGYPTFMNTDAWQLKELTTALASWSQLRHDTILYAKQSYTPTLKTSLPIQRDVVGYVEPVPEFYNRLLALTKMTNKGLSDMNVIDETAKSRLNNLENILSWLLHISIKELNNEQLNKEDYDFIKNFDEYINGVINDVDENAKKTTIIADVHTDQNPPKEVLEEATGYVRLLIAAYLLPDGRILIGAGPTMSYYEFKQPLDNRLTDENWRQLLSTTPPEVPKWMFDYSFYE